MKYLSVSQTAEKWGISTRRIQILCGEGRVPGAIRIGTVWGIPEDAEKHADARIKNGKYIKKPVEAQIISATLTRKKDTPYSSRVLMGALTPCHEST